MPLAAVSCLFPDDPPDREHDDFELFRLTVRRLRERGPVLLAVDDAHLLDEGSAGLVHHLVADGCVTLVATVVAGPGVRADPGPGCAASPVATRCTCVSCSTPVSRPAR